MLFTLKYVRSNDPVDEVVTKTTDNADPIVPLELQTGFSLPDGVDSSRFLLAFGNIPPCLKSRNTGNLNISCTII